MRLFRYTVRGNGRFPFDMLRRDSAFPAEVADAYQIGQSHLEAREVELLVRAPGDRAWRPCEGCWRSFGWSVVKFAEIPAPREES